MRSDGISVDPKLPVNWCALAFSIQWQGRSLKIRIDRDKQRLEARLKEGDPMTFAIGGGLYELRCDQVLEAHFGAKSVAFNDS